MNLKCLLAFTLLWATATRGMASDHPAFDRQKERDRRLSQFSMELEQYGVIQRNFSIERMKEVFASSKFSDFHKLPPRNDAPLPPSDSEGYSDASFRFLMRIDAFDKFTHIDRRTLSQDHLPFAFPGLPTQIRITNASGYEQGFSRDDSSRYSGYTVAEDKGVISFRRTILEWCSGFGLTRYVTQEEQVQETSLGNGLVECTGSLNLPWIGYVQFRAELDQHDVVRSVFVQKPTHSLEMVTHLVTNSGKYTVESDTLATHGSYVREVPFHSVDGQQFRKSEIDDGFTTVLHSLTTKLSDQEFATRSDIKQIPRETRVIDATNGKAKIPLRAGTDTRPGPKSRFWLFTLNLAAIVGFVLYHWRKRSRPILNQTAGEVT